VKKRMERKGEKGSEEDDYFNKFPPTMPSVVLENRLIRMFKVSYRSAPKTASLSPSSPFSSSLPLSLLPSHPPPHYLSPSSSLLLSLLALLFLLPLSLLPLPPTHCLSPSFLSILLPHSGREVERMLDRNEGAK
jgi:hypothetical protein